MFWRYALRSICALLASAVLSGCSGVLTLPERALPGSTVMVALGSHPRLMRKDVAVGIAASNGVAYQYAPGDPRIRYMINAYSDPLSHLVVRDGARMDPSGGYADDIRREVTYGDNEWAETFLFMDIPTDIAPGVASLSFTSSGASLTPRGIQLEILPGGPVTQNKFLGFRPPSGQTQVTMGMREMERAAHFVVTVSGPEGVVPHSMQVRFSRSLGATGESWVTQGRGDLKNIMWSDNGTELIVLLTPTKGVSLSDLRDLRFYVSGAVTTLAVLDIKAYDTLGNPLSGFSAQLEQVN